jgi:hypothetical protein
MTKWVSTPIALTANMVAGTDALLVAEPIAATNKVLRAIQSRSAATPIELFFGGAAVGVAGQGIPLAAGARIDFHGDVPFNGAIWLLGGLAAEYVVLVYG